MPEAIKYVLDAATTFALFLALLVVLLVDRVFLSGVSANTLPVNVIESESRHRGSKRLRLAVTPTGGAIDPFTNKAEKWDDMGKLLSELGEGYRHDNISIQDTMDPKKLADYDVVFLTCNSGAEDELRGPLLDYVTNGGILYASDWRYDTIAKAFPDMVARGLRGDGRKQELKADIVDPALSEAIGKKDIDLRFDLDEWKTAAFGGPRVKVLMQGNYLKYKPAGGPDRATAPLMVKFQVGKGTVIFTSFHNEKQNSRTEKLLLQYLVYSLVTAGVDAEVSGTMEKGGFTPQRSNLLSTSSEPTIRKEYNNAKQTTLRFALGFRNEGAELRLTIKAPDGKQYTWQGTSTVIVEVPDAQPGMWTYSITALRMPYANFPFTVTVGEKK